MKTPPDSQSSKKLSGEGKVYYVSRVQIRVSDLQFIAGTEEPKSTASEIKEQDR